MARLSGILLALSALIALTAPGVAGALGSPGELSSEALVVDGLDREYRLYTPSRLSDGQAVPLVIVFHGGGGTARGIAREVGKTLHRIADREGFFVVYPDAIDKMWDFGAGLISESLEVRIDDRAFFSALLDELVQALPIDRTRVFATGISRGGQASYFVACQFPGKIRAIAPVAMPMPEFMRSMCTDARGVGVLVMNGTEDPLVPYDGGQIKVGRRERGAVMSTDATIDFWRTQNGCGNAPRATETMNDARDRMQVHVTRWTECDHAPVSLYQIEGGGHTWPSGRQYLPRIVVGRVNRDIDGASEAWKFFSGFAPN